MVGGSHLRRFLVNVYGYSFFNCLVFMYPIYMLFFSNNGISDAGKSVLLILWSLSVVAVQVPVLSLATKFSRKHIMIAAALLKAATFIVWIIWPTFWGFAFGFFLWGINWAAYNVVWEAMIYDELAARRHRAIYAKVVGRKTALENAALIVACSGSLMIPLGYTFIAAVSTIAMIISVAFLIMINTKAAPAKRRINAIKQLRVTGAVLRRAPYVFYLLVLCSLLYAFSQVDDYLALIGVEMGIRPEFVGAMFVMALICQTMGSAVADRFERVSDKALFAGVVFVGLILAIFGMKFSVVGLMLLALFYFISSIIQILVYSRFQHAIPGAARSAFLSAYSFLEQGTSIMSYAVFIVGVTLGGGYRLGVFLSGLVSVLIGLWAMAYIPRKKELTERLASIRKATAAALG